MDCNGNIELQVLLCTFGEEGMERVVKSCHPEVEGVEYVVLWQQPDSELPVPECLAARSDFKVYTDSSRGVSRNRNRAIEAATAPLALMGDDDVDYDADGLRLLLECARTLPDADILLCRYTQDNSFIKPYPAAPVPFREAPKGYYVTAFEIAFRPQAVQKAGIWFNENISIGTPVLRCGEENVFIRDAEVAHLKMMVIPVTIGAHDHPTTTDRDSREPYFVMTQGAIMTHVHPHTWPARLLVHAWRQQKRGYWNFFQYLRHCMAGIAYARRNHVFDSRRKSY